MSDIRPQKGKVTLLVKSIWGVHCEACWTDVNRECENQGRETPAIQDKEFFIPMNIFDWICPHKTGKPYLFESVYGKRTTKT